MSGVVPRVSRLERMIETKEATRTVRNLDIPHNNMITLAINPFNISQGIGDPMDQNSGARIGDQIAIRGLMIRGMLQNSLGRARVYFRVMLIKSAKGDTLDRSTLFKNSSDNKMIDQINTERYTVIAQKIFTISTSNPAPLNFAPVTGVPSSNTPAGIATRTIKMWIPGRKFGRDGVLRYENTTLQPKFFDYRVCVLSYDWYQTPQDVNNVGFVNEIYTKLYFKDA